MRRPLIIRILSGRDGQALVETALTATLLITLLLAAIDFGRAYYMLVELKGAAHAGALYGAQFPTDKQGMISAAQSDATDFTMSSTPTADWGCECSDGTNATAESGGSCTITCTTTNEVYYVWVTTNTTYSPLVPWPGIPSSMTLTETVQMRAAVP